MRAKKIRDYRDLDVYEVSMDLVTVIYRVTRKMPADERFGLTFQLRKAAVSVPSNIAEGYGRRTTPEYRHFVNIAAGSVREMHTQLVLTVRLGMLTEEDVAEALELNERAGRMLTKLVRSLASD